jgi:hypothetical protein
LLPVLLPTLVSWTAHVWLQGYLPVLFGVQAEVGRVRVHPWTGAVEIREVRLAQPPGFEERPMLEVHLVKGRVDLRALLGRRVRLDKVAFDGAVLRLRHAEQAGFNAARLALFAGDAEPAPTPVPSGPGWRVDLVTVSATNVQVSWQDSRHHGELALVGLHGVVTNLVVAGPGARAGTGAAGIWLEGAWAQQAGPPASFLASGWLGPLGAGLPEGALSVNLAGWLPHATLLAAWPAAAEACAKDEAVDAALALSVSAEGVDGTADITDLAGRALVRVEHGVYAWDEGVGSIRLAGGWMQPGGAPAVWEAMGSFQPGGPLGWPAGSVTGVIHGIRLPRDVSAPWRAWHDRFVSGPLDLVAAGTWNAAAAIGSLTVEDGAPTPVLQALGLGYDFRSGDVVLEDFGLRQPSGFGPGPMAALRRVRLRLDRDFIETRRIEVLEGEALGLDMALVRNEHGELNVACLSGWGGGAAPEAAGAVPSSRSPAAPDWSLAVNNFNLTNAALTYRDLAWAEAGARHLATLWGNVREATLFAGTASAQPLGGMASLAGIWNQAPLTSATFHASVRATWPGRGQPDLAIACGFEHARVSSFGNQAPAWCRALLGETELSGNLDVHATEAGLAASGRVEEPQGRTAAGFESLTLDLATGEWRVHGLTVAQPESFGAGPLLDVGEARLRLDESWAPGRPLRIREVEIADMRMSVSRDAAGSWNWGLFAGGGASVGDAGNPTGSDRPGPGLAGVTLDRIRIERGGVLYKDQWNRVVPATAGVDIIVFQGTNLTLGRPDDSRPSAGGFQLEACLSQAGAPPAPLAIEARREAVEADQAEWYGVLTLAGWSPSDFLFPEGRVVWDRDIGPVDVAAALAWSPGLADVAAEVRLADGRLLAACESADWQPAAGEARVRGLLVASPPVFRAAPVLEVSDARVRVAPETLARPPLLVEKAGVLAPALCLVRNRAGEWNTDYLEALLMRDPAAVASEPEPAAPAVPLLLEDVAIQGLRIRYEDDAVGDDGIRMRLSGLDARARHVALGAGHGLLENWSGQVTLRAPIEQREAPPGFFELTADTEADLDGDYDVHVEAALVGLAPRSLAGILPAVMVKGLEGETLSLLVNAVVCRQSVDVAGALETFSGRTLAAVGGLDYWWSSGDLLLTDLRVAQVPGFGDGLLLVAPTVHARVARERDAGGGLRFEQIGLDGVGIFPVRDRTGRLNFTALTESHRAAPANRLARPRRESEPPAGVVVEHLAITNLFGMYTDHSAGGAVPTVIRVDRLKALGANLRWGGAAGADEPQEPGGFGFAARLVQSPLTNGFVGGLARFGALGPGTPVLKGVFRVVGLELATLAGWLPANTAELLGGDAVDVAADLDLASDRLSCDLRVLTCADTRFSLAFRGTPARPELDTGSVLYGILVRAGGGLGATFRHAAGAGVDVVRSAVQTTRGLGQGAWRVAGSVGSGLYTTMRGVFTADLREVTDGLAQTTVGAIGETADTLLQAGGSLLGTAVRTATHRSRAAQEWRGRNRDRWVAAWQDAQRTMDMPAGRESGR